MRKYIILFGAGLLSSFMLSFILFQDDPLKKILQQIEKYREAHPQEKVHVHMDKPYYAIGDTIWFKTYVVSAENNLLSDLSQVVYVDLINEKDSVKHSRKLPLTFGLAWGDFVLSDSLQEGNYRIRAYTQWMRNFGEEFFFDKTIVVGNSLSSKVMTEAIYTFSKQGQSEKVVADLTYTDLDGNPYPNKEVNYRVALDFRQVATGKAMTDMEGKLRIEFLNTQPFILKSGKIHTSIKLNESAIAQKSIPIKSTSGNADVQFFPESGNLIMGLNSKVGFKAVGSDGLGINISGRIIDDQGTKLAEFTSEYAGMGSFNLKPLEGRNYHALLKFEDGSERKFELPKVNQNGYVLHVDNTGNNEQLHLKVLTTERASTDAMFTLIAQSNGIVQYVSKNKLDGNSFSASLPKSRFPTGILQLTLFGKDHQPAAERLVFINHHDFLNIQLNELKTTTSKRDKIHLNLNVINEKERPVVGSFSIAVTDESKIPFDDDRETSILSNLLLTADLKGFVENPNYYFSQIDKGREKHLDNLLLTQGWRRFEWRNVLSEHPLNLAFQPETTMKVSGTVKTINGKPVSGGAVTLLSTSGELFLLDTVTNENGEFIFDKLYFTDNTKFVVQARNAKDRKNVEIMLDRIPPQMVTRNKNEALLEVNVNSSILPYLKEKRNVFDEMRRYGLLHRSIMLDEVTVVEKKPVLTNSSNLNGAGNADAIIRDDVLENCYDLAQCLQGRVAGIMVMNGIVYSSRSMNTSFSGPVPMQIILDGMYVEPDFISSINPRDVESIEVLKSGAYTSIYGMRGGGGVLVINTKRGDRNASYQTFAPGIVTYRPQGFYISRAFYSPVYSATAKSKIPDLRSTIYWNPNVVTDSTGKAIVEFYNADGPGKYKIVIEGIDINGKLGRYTQRYNVN